MHPFRPNRSNPLRLRWPDLIAVLICMSMSGNIGASTLTTQDLANSASFNASSQGGTIGVGSSLGATSLGVGISSGNAASTTQASISGIAGNTAVRTGDAGTGIKTIFNKDEVQADVNGQVVITGAFGQQGSKAVGTYAQTQYEEAKARDDKEGMALWAEGGAARVGLHAVVGALGGGVNGATGAVTSQVAVPVLADLLAPLDLPLPVKQIVIQVGGALVGGATGGTAGVASAVNATGNNYLTHTELKSRAEQQRACDKGNTQACAAVREIDKTSVERNEIIRDGVAVVTPAQGNQILQDMQTTMAGLSDYKTNLQSQLEQTSDPQQRAQLQSQINEADNNMKQVASLGKDYHYQLYVTTKDPKYLTAYVQLNTATNGNDLADAMMTTVVALGSTGKSPKAGAATTTATEGPLPVKSSGVAGDASAPPVGANGGVTAIGSVADANFAQSTIRASEIFSKDGIANYSQLAGRPINTVDDLAAALQSGAIKPSQLPVDYVVATDGTKLILNTRTSVALDRAGVPKSDWYGTNKTGVSVPDMPGKTFDDLAADQLKNNKLPPTGTPTIPTGKK